MPAKEVHMAIMGFLVHALPQESKKVEASLKNLPELTTYGIHQDDYIVAVAEAAHQDMEGVLERVQALEGVLTCYVTSLSMEDELPDDTAQGRREDRRVTGGR